MGKAVKSFHARATGRASGIEERTVDRTELSLSLTQGRRRPNYAQ